MNEGFSKYGSEYFLGDEFGEMEYFIVPFLIRFKIVLKDLKGIDMFVDEEISSFIDYSEKCFKNEVFLQTTYKAKPNVETSSGMKGYFKNHDTYDYETYLIDSYRLYTAKKN